MKRRMLVGSAMVGAIVCMLALPASAHVTIDPPSVPRGSTAKLSFLVPNEEAKAKTNEVEIFFPPQPNAIPSVSVEAKPGWIVTVKKQHLTQPIVTGDGTINEVVSSIDWKAVPAAAIGTDEFGEFTIDADGIPKDADQLVFKAVQGYSDGTVVRWVDPVTAGGPAADHPTPILELTDGAAPLGAETPSTTVPAGTKTTTVVATSTKDDNARALAVVAVVLGAVALLFGTAALMRKRRA